MRQQVYLINPRKFRIHRAEREGVRGRALTVNPHCQIYPPYFDLYDVLTDLHSLGEGVPGWRLCKFCFPTGSGQLSQEAYTDLRSKKRVAFVRSYG